MQSFTKELWKSLFKNFSPSRFFIHTILNSANIIKKRSYFLFYFVFYLILRFRMIFKDENLFPTLNY